MFVVEKLENGVWIEMSTHTKQGDAERQILIFGDHGILSENLRIIQVD